MKEQWNRYLTGKAELHGVQMRNRKKRRGKCNPKGIVGPQPAGNVNSTEHEALLAAAAKVKAIEREGVALGSVDLPECEQNGGKGRGKGRGRGRGVARGRGRSRAGRGSREASGGRGMGNTEKTVEVIELLSDEDTESDFSEFKGRKKVPREEKPAAPADTHVAAHETGIKLQTMVPNSERESIPEKTVPPVHFYALDSEQRVLQVIRPQCVIVFDPDMGFVRELELYKAENPSKPLKVYFLFYEDSTEARKFEAGIRRENRAFESLIRQKATMMIPVDQVYLWFGCKPCLYFLPFPDATGFVGFYARIDGKCSFHLLICAQDGRMLDLTPPPQSATGVSLNPNTRKAGGRKAIEKKMRVSSRF